MPVIAEPSHPSRLADIAGPIAALVERNLVREAEVIIAALAAWTVDRLQSGSMTPEQADDIFTQIDVQLTRRDGDTPLSEETQELLFEGEHFHHFGEVHGPDPEHLKQLANAILSGRQKGQHSDRALPSADDVSSYLADHPEGVRLGEMAAYFDAPRREMSRVVKELVDDGRARQDEEHRRYFAEDEA
jgi:hypothetical protein